MDYENVKDSCDEELDEKNDKNVSTSDNAAKSKPIYKRPCIREGIHIQKRQNVGTKTSKTYVAQNKSTGFDLLKASMAGLQQEAERHRANKAEELNSLHSESKSEQRLKRVKSKQVDVSQSSLLQNQHDIILTSIKSVPIWRGSLTTDLAEFDEHISIVAHGISGNVHSMDAVLKLSIRDVKGTMRNAQEMLDMSVLEAADYAAIVFKGLELEDTQKLARLISKHLLPMDNLLQVPLGEDKPIWLALLPACNDTLLGTLVKVPPQFKHSNLKPTSSLLEKKLHKRRRKVDWPDSFRNTKRSLACERGPGSKYSDRPSGDLIDDDVEDNNTLGSASIVNQKSLSVDPGPLSFLRVALIGFLRHHEKIRQLRHDLQQAGAQIFTNNSPWPGCVTTIVFPEQMVEKDLGLEKYAPLEMEPIKEFLLHKNTRFFLKIDYPILCCRLLRYPTREEENEYKIKELWPEGINLLAEAPTLDALVNMPNDVHGNVLEQIFTMVHKASQSAQCIGSVWQFCISQSCFENLQKTCRPAYKILQFWINHKRCKILDPHLVFDNIISSGVHVAHFYRYYCRHTLLIFKGLGGLNEAAMKKTIHVTEIKDTVQFLQNIL